MENSTDMNVTLPMGFAFIVLSLSLFSMIVLLIFVFPCYVLVHRANRERDKGLTVFPIINHFYQAVCMFYLGLLICVFVTAVIWFHNRNFMDYITQIIPVILIFGILMIFVQAHNFIIALLSIQRFLLFFFRNIEEYLKYSEEKSNKVFNGIYIFFYLVHFLILGFYGYLIEVEKLDDWPVRVYLCFYVFVNLVLLASAILYIPIMIRIRKLARLSLTNQNRQQKYILYQTMSIVIFKMSHAWIVFLVESGSFPLYMYITVFLIFDLVSTPVLIQVSYLLCTRQNVDILRKSLYIDKFSNWSWAPSQVEPVARRNDLLVTSVV